MANEGYHEPIAELSIETRDMHRAITSLMEELEAVDWYNQRVDACHDPELRAILEHNRDEEKEHAAMVSVLLQHDNYGSSAPVGFCSKAQCAVNGLSPLQALKRSGGSPQERPSG